MNVWIVFEESGAYSGWNRDVAGVFSERGAADAYAQRMNDAHLPVCRHPSKPWPDSPGHFAGHDALYCGSSTYEASGDGFWVVDAVPDGGAALVAHLASGHDTRFSKGQMDRLEYRDFEYLHTGFHGEGMTDHDH